MPQSGCRGRSATAGTTYQGNTVGLSRRKDVRHAYAAPVAERARQAIRSAAISPAPARILLIPRSDVTTSRRSDQAALLNSQWRA